MEWPDTMSRWHDLPRPVAFVLSGDSSLGALHVGMLRAVREVGIEPDLLVGTSVGALNAAFMGAGFNRERIDLLEGVWPTIKTRHVFAGLGWVTARPRPS
jgi:NTE family protein